MEYQLKQNTPTLKILGLTEHYLGHGFLKEKPYSRVYLQLAHELLLLTSPMSKPILVHEKRAFSERSWEIQMNVFKVYCDESRQTGPHEYRLVAGVWATPEAGWALVRDFESRCRSLGRHTPFGELSFKYVPSRPEHSVMRYYEALIDSFLDLYDARKDIFFRTVIVSKDYNFRHPDYNNGDYEAGFYKLVYQLLLHRIELHNSYHIRLDRRSVNRTVVKKTEQDRLNDLKVILNKGINKRFKKPADFVPPVKTVESRKSQDYRLIQLADVIMGAIGYVWNNEHRKKNRSEGKVHLCRYLAHKIGKPDLTEPTVPSEWPVAVDIFYHQPGKTGKKTAPQYLQAGVPPLHRA